MDQNFDVIISGAGPAGSTCALFLAKAGKKVLLIEKEKFPRDKICADNKTWKCLDIIKELGLWSEFEKLPKKEINGVLVASPAGNEFYTPLLKSDVKEKGPWFNVRRELFDNFLAKACTKNKNITLLENCETKNPIIEDGNVIGLEFYNKKSKKIQKEFAKIVVGADGSNSPVANSLNLSPKLKGRYALNCRAYYKGVGGRADACELYYLKGICPGYFWIFPVDNGMYNIGVGMRLEDIEAQNINLEGKMEEMINSEKFKARFAKAKRVTKFGTWGISVLPGKRKWSGSGFILIGDAGTFAMTFSGEGVGPSMRSGKIAAKAINEAYEADDFSAKSLHRFDEKMWEILKPETQGFRWLEFLILNEVIFDWVAKKSGNNKDLIEISSRMQNDYSAARELFTPKTFFKLLFG